MTDYTFYNGTYLSGKEAVFTAASFPYWERKASNKVRIMTMGNIDENEEISDTVQSCVCEVAEVLFRQSNDSTKAQSEKVGDYSVTYKQRTAQDDATDIISVVNQWLAPTGLLYCGTGCGC